MSHKPSLHVYLLGFPRVEDHGAIIRFNSRKTFALLAYLAVGHGALRRDTLAALLWPDSAPTKARAYLRNSLYNLRTHLGESRFHADRDSIGLKFDGALRVDVISFRDLLEECEKHPHDQSDVCPSCLNPLSQAMELFRGDFLAGFTIEDSVEFDDWQRGLAESLRSDVDLACDRLVRCLRATGQIDRGIDVARKWLALDRMNERAHRHLMRLYAGKGQNLAALRQFDECTRILREELHAEPDQTTLGLCEDIRTGKLQEQKIVTRPMADVGFSNLPVQPTRFIGRKLEKKKVMGLLSSSPLVTLTGTGGCGKTRLALEVAADCLADYTEGVRLADLSPVTNPEHVTYTVARALDVHEEQGQTLHDSLLSYLENRELLLVLDNCEHLVQAVAELAEALLSRGKNLGILVTSREPLTIPGETVWRVAPLEVPEEEEMDAGVLTGYDAIALFLDRAGAALPGFLLTDANADVVAQIARHLDGIPLALELAAVRLRALSEVEILSRLDRRFELLTGGRTAHSRHQTLRSTVDWSYELLEAKERVLLARFSVFVGDWTLEAAEAICSDSESEAKGIRIGCSEIPELLARLVDKSLVMARADGVERRYRQLETFRQYGAVKLEIAGEAEALRKRHADWYLCLAERAEIELHGPKQMEWLGRLDGEYNNFRSALSWFSECANVRDGLRMAGALGWYWFRRGRPAEGRHWLGSCLAESGESQSAASRAKSHYYLAWLRYLLFSPRACQDDFAKCLQLYRRAGDKRGASLSLVWVGWFEAWLGGDKDSGYAHMDESVAIARESGDPWAVAFCLRMASSAHPREDKEIAAKRASLEEAIDLARKTGDPFILCFSVHGMGDVYRLVGQHTEAEPWFLDALKLAREMKDRYLTLSTVAELTTGYIALEQVEKAKRYLAEAIRLAADCGSKGSLVGFLWAYGKIAELAGNNGRAVRLWGAADRIRFEIADYKKSLAYRSELEPVERFIGKDEKLFAAWEVGRAMTVEQAVAYALEVE